MTTPDALATSAGSAESPATFDGGLTARDVQRIAMVINADHPLTASAFAEDRERWFEARMDDYLSKPVRSE